MSVRIITGDCRDVMLSLPGGSVDCVIADPPYGETDLVWDRRCGGWLHAAHHVLAPHGSLWCFGSMRFFIERAADLAGWSIAQDVIWEKHNGSSLHNDRFRRVHEQLIHLYPAERPWGKIYKQPVYTNDAVARTIRRKSKPAHWHGIGEGIYRSEDGGPRLVRSVFHVRSEHGRAEHPTQKPVAVVAPLIEYSCRPGGVVLDPFAGSGTTGIAAQQLGRDAILIEISPAYCDMARRRIAGDAPLLTSVA